MYPISGGNKMKATEAFKILDKRFCIGMDCGQPSGVLINRDEYDAIKDNIKRTRKQLKLIISNKDKAFEALIGNEE
jgi:hypothetical protein